MSTLGLTWRRPDAAWDPAQVDELRRLHANPSLSYADIADLLGVSRCAISGKVSRMGLPKRQPSGGRHGRKPRARNTPFRMPPPAPECPQEPQGRSVVRDRAATPDCLTPLLDLGPKGCRWPEGDRVPYRFCGCPRWGESSYCGYHFALATRGGG
jgi:hypothetical protein